MNSRFALDREPFSATITHVLGFHFTVSFEKNLEVTRHIALPNCPPTFAMRGICHQVTSLYECYITLVPVFPN